MKPVRTPTAEWYPALGPARRFYTCEHASNRVPRPLHTRAHDGALLRDHWGYDIGAANVTRELARLDGAGAVLSRVSRLVVDVNRTPEDPTLVLADTGEGRPSFNHVYDREERVRLYHAPFHDLVNTRIEADRPALLVSIHSFTPVYRGQVRTVEAGVLFDQHDELSLRLVERLRAQGLRTEPNEPYSGKAGLIYSAHRHGHERGLPYVEIELRQDLIASGREAREVARRVWRALRAVG